MAYLQTSPFPNGCFITAASCELDGLDGPLRDRLAEVVTDWHAFLLRQVQVAQRDGDIATDREPADLVQLLVGLAMAANQGVQLLNDDGAVDRARALMLDLVFGDRRGGRHPGRRGSRRRAT